MNIGRNEQRNGLKVFLIITFIIIAFLAICWATGLIHWETTSDETDLTFNQNDITITYYSQDWLDNYATISFLNNTDKTITSISGRMIYFDMSGNMLDYQDFTQKITIDPGMVKRTTIRGYGRDEYYAYYKSNTSGSRRERKYKFKFELKSYKVQ